MIQLHRFLQITTAEIVAESRIDSELLNFSFGCFASRWSWTKSPLHHKTTLSNSVFKQKANLKFATSKTKTESSRRVALTTQVRQNNFLERRTPFLAERAFQALSCTPAFILPPAIDRVRSIYGLKSPLWRALFAEEFQKEEIFG